MLSSITSSFPDIYAAQFFGASAANDESTPSDAPALGHTQADGLVAQPVGIGGECPELLPSFIPTSDKLWECLTGGYSWTHIAKLRDGHPFRPKLMARAYAAWVQIRKEVGC